MSDAKLETLEGILRHVPLLERYAADDAHLLGNPPVCGVSVLPTEASLPHWPSPNIHNRNHHEQLFTRPWKVGCRREKGAVTLALTDTAEFGGDLDLGAVTQVPIKGPSKSDARKNCAPTLPETW